MILLKYSLAGLWEAAPRHSLDSAELPLFVNVCSLRSEFFCDFGFCLRENVSSQCICFLALTLRKKKREILLGNAIP